MPSRIVNVASGLGLHARPASVFVQAACNAGVPVLIGRPGQAPVNAASILKVMAIGARCGEPVQLTTDEAGSAALDSLCALLTRDLDAV